MYAKRISNQRLDRALPALRKAISPTFDYTEHSIAQADSFVNHMRGVALDKRGYSPIEYTRQLTPDEVEWILNERTLSTCSWVYWATRYAKIRDISNRIIRYAPNLAQKVFLSILEEMESDELELILQFLKARRLGISTICQLILAHRFMFHPNTFGMIASDNPKDSDKLSKMFFLAYDNTPPWLRPQIERYSKGSYYEFSNGNRVDIQHGSQEADPGRGENPLVFHWCVAPSTLVLTKDGIAKPITEIVEGDRVLLSNGDLGSVRALIRSPRNNELASKILLHGNFMPLVSTRDHRILTPQGFQPASSLASGDFVSFPVRPIIRAIKTVEIQHQRMEKSSPHRWHGVVPTDFNLGWFLGLYLAEGSVPARNGNTGQRFVAVTFAIHEKEVEQFSAQLKKAIPTLEVAVQRRTSKTVVLRIAASSSLATWVAENFGRKDQKRIPDWVWDCGIEFCKGIVAGYIEGDGHISASSLPVEATSTRLQLVTQLRELVASLGFGWSSLQFKESSVRYGRNCADAWRIVFCGETAAKLRQAFHWSQVHYDKRGYLNHWRYSKDQKFIEVEVDEVSDTFEREFYDLEIDSPLHDFCTIQCTVHNSECAKIQDPESLIDSGLMKAVIPNPDVFGVFEGTAEGNDGWWFDKYWYNKANYGKPGSGARMKPAFLPWVIGRDIYPSPVWLKSNRWDTVKDSWKPQESTMKEAERAKDFVRSDPLIRKHLGKDWEMPLEQMYFYESSIKEYKQNNTLHVWAQEMASDDISAFASREQSVFDPELRLAYRQSCAEPLHVYGIRGGGIPERFWPSKKDWKLDNRGQPIVRKLVADWTPSLPPLVFEFIELKFHGYSNTNPFGKLFIWEEPANGETYSFGADSSNGFGEKRSDNSVLEMFRKGSRWKLDAQVAEFATPDMSGADLWLIGMAVGTYYSVHVNGKLKQPRCVPEINREGGLTFLREMQRHGWKEFHTQVKMSAATRRGQPTVTYGWYSDSVNRPDLVQRGAQAIKEEYIELNSPWLVSEMDVLISDPVTRKIGAVKGKHDDRLFALWLPFISIYDDEVRATGRSPFQERQRVVPEEEKYPWFQDSQSYDTDIEVIRQ